MFTGLIQDLGRVERVQSGPMTDVWVASSFEQLVLGESIACDGCCLTVVETKSSSFRVQASFETLARTTLGDWRTGTQLNLERALKVGDRLGGHWVQGHVDGVARIESIKPEGGAVVVRIELPQALAPYFIEKGSVAVDGISLTVNGIDANAFWVALIPETVARTSLGRKAAGAKVNLEADIIGKYVARQQSLKSSAVSHAMLRDAGFTST